MKFHLGLLSLLAFGAAAQQDHIKAEWIQEKPNKKEIQIQIQPKQQSQDWQTKPYIIVEPFIIPQKQELKNEETGTRNDDHQNKNVNDNHQNKKVNDDQFHKRQHKRSGSRQQREQKYHNRQEIRQYDQKRHMKRYEDQQSPTHRDHKKGSKHQRAQQLGQMTTGMPGQQEIHEERHQHNDHQDFSDDQETQSTRKRQHTGKIIGNIAFFGGLIAISLCFIKKCIKRRKHCSIGLKSQANEMNTMSIDDKINLHYEAIRKLQERQTIINQRRVNQPANQGNPIIYYEMPPQNEYMNELPVINQRIQQPVGVNYPEIPMGRPIQQNQFMNRYY